jgi:hypothetical protein
MLRDDEFADALIPMFNTVLKEFAKERDAVELVGPFGSPLAPYLKPRTRAAAAAAPAGAPAGTAPADAAGATRNAEAVAADIEAAADEPPPSARGARARRSARGSAHRVGLSTPFARLPNARSLTWLHVR